MFSRERGTPVKTRPAPRVVPCSFVKPHCTLRTLKSPPPVCGCVCEREIERGETETETETERKLPMPGRWLQGLPSRARLVMTLQPLLDSTALHRAYVSWKYIIGTQALPMQEVLAPPTGDPGKFLASDCSGPHILSPQGLLEIKDTHSP